MKYNTKYLLQVPQAKQSMSKDSKPSTSNDDIALIGYCHDAEFRDWYFDITGLSSLPHVPVFPHNMQRGQIVLAIPTRLLATGFRYHIECISTTNPSNKAWLDGHIPGLPQDPTKNIEQGPGLAETPQPEPDNTTNDQIKSKPSSVSIPPFYHDAKHSLITADCPPLTITQPEAITVTIRINDDEECHLGAIHFFHLVPKPITEEERRAIQSRPNCRNHIALHVTCKHCGEEARLIEPLVPGTKPDPFTKHDHMLPELGDTWECGCGKTSFPLVYAKRGMKAYLRNPATNAGSIVSHRRYGRQAIANIRNNYDALINSSPSEEQVQKFLENNPIAWAFLSANEIHHKPKVLTGHVADFGLMSVSGTFYLVEIEKPQTRICRKDGGRTAEFEKGIKQLRDWQHIIVEHRHAFFSELGIDSKSVPRIEYIIIAGLESQEDPVSISKIKRSGMGDQYNFYTFDQLAAFLQQLEIEMHWLA